MGKTPIFYFSIFMTFDSQYIATWKQLKDSGLILADFNSYPKIQKESTPSKTIFDLLITFILFILFSFSLSWINQQYNSKIGGAILGQTISDINKVEQIYNSQTTYTHFQQGYIGQNLIEIERFDLNYKKSSTPKILF